MVIPCSGIGKVHGLISREATYIATEELLPEDADTVCLALLVMGDPETTAKVGRQPCITVDGCGKACAQKNVELAGGRVAEAFQVATALKRYRGAQPGDGTALTEEGWAIATDVAETVAAEVTRLRATTKEMT